MQQQQQQQQQNLTPLPREYWQDVPLGRGMGGQVFRLQVAEGDYNNKLVAKVVNKTRREGTDEQKAKWAQGQRAALIRELRMLEEVRFKNNGHTPYNIVRGLGLFESRHNENRGQLFLIMQGFMGGTLEKKIRVEGHCNENVARPLIKRMVEALKLLHACETARMSGPLPIIIHKDVKPANIVLSTNDNHPVLIDFGLAVFKTAEFDAELQDEQGHDKYMSPEFMKNRIWINKKQPGKCSAIDEKVDCWAVGITLFETLMGLHRVPFHCIYYEPDTGHREDCEWAEIVRQVQNYEFLWPAPPEKLATKKAAELEEYDEKATILRVPDDVHVTGGRPQDRTYFHRENEGRSSYYVTEREVTFHLRRPVQIQQQAQPKQQEKQKTDEKCPKCQKPMHCQCSHLMEETLVHGITGECLPDALCTLSVHCLDFLAGLLTYDKDLRMSMNAALQHPFITHPYPGVTRFYSDEKFYEDYNRAKDRQRKMVVFIFNTDVNEIPIAFKTKQRGSIETEQEVPIFVGRTLFLAVPYQGEKLMQSDVYHFLRFTLFSGHWDPVQVFEVISPSVATDPAADEYRRPLLDVPTPMLNPRCVYVQRIDYIRH